MYRKQLFRRRRVVSQFELPRACRVAQTIETPNYPILSSFNSLSPNRLVLLRFSVVRSPSKYLNARSNCYNARNKHLKELFPYPNVAKEWEICLVRQFLISISIKCKKGNEKRWRRGSSIISTNKKFNYRRERSFRE